MTAFKIHASLFLSTFVQAKKAWILPLLVEYSNHTSSYLHVGSLNLCLPVTTIKTRSQYIFLLPEVIADELGRCAFFHSKSHNVTEKPFFFLVSSWYFCSIIDIHWRRKCFLRHGHGVIVVRGSDQINHNQTLQEGTFTCFSRDTESSTCQGGRLGKGGLL